MSETQTGRELQADRRQRDRAITLLNALYGYRQPASVIRAEADVQLVLQTLTATRRPLEKRIHQLTGRPL